MRHAFLAIVIALLIILTPGIARPEAEFREEQARSVIEEYLAKYKPLDLQERQAWYAYTSTGDKTQAARKEQLELSLRQLDSDPIRFAVLKDLYSDRSQITDPIVRRQIELLYLGHLPNQVAPEKLAKLTQLENQIERDFNDYRPEVDGKKLTPVDVTQILADSTDSVQLEKVWKAQHLVGPVIEKNYRDLVKLRNEIAQDLGYRNALELAAVAQEMDLEMLDRFYDEIHQYTDPAFKRLKEEYIDPRLADRYKVPPTALQPWHYQNAFFQAAPTAIFGNVDLNALYTTIDSERLIAQAIDFYRSLGIDVNPIIRHSSLYPAAEKNPHAMAWFMNPEQPGSSLLIMNLPIPPQLIQAVDAATLMHELAHGINFEAILNNPEIPYLLRSPTMLTEAFALQMENQTKTADWFMHLGIPATQAHEVADTVALENYVDQLIFLHWSGTIYCFEKAIYSDPDTNISDRWWECKARNQLQQRPENWVNPDALAKYHIPNVAPLYYSSYVLGTIANVQIEQLFDQRFGRTTAGDSFYGKPALGEWLMHDFLAQGERYRWDDFLVRMTGTPLSVQTWTHKYIGSKFEQRLYQQ